MDHKELGTNSAVSASPSDGSTKFAVNSATVQPSRHKSYDAGSNSSGKVDTAAARPCAIIGPDRVLPLNPNDTTYLKKMPAEAWPPPENVYRRPPDYPAKISDYQPARNISPRQTFQENMPRIMVPPTFSSMKNSEESTLKHSKLNMPVQAKYCDVPYNVNSVNGEHKNVRNADIPISNVNSPYARNMPPPYEWSAGVNVRPLRPYGAPEFFQYQEFSSCAGPRPMAMTRPHRPLHDDTAQVYSHRLYQDANIRFKPYPTGKEKHLQTRYDHIGNYPSTFHPPASIPPHKYDLQRTVHGHPYPVYPSVPFNYLDRRIHDPFVEGYQRHHSQQAGFNSFHNQGVPPPYGPIPGNCIQNKTYSDASSKSMNSNRIQFENNNKVYLNLESRNKYSVPENVYYNEINHSQALRGDILLPTHSLNIHPMPQHSHSIFRKDNTPIKPYDYNPNYRIFDQSINLNPSLQRLPLQFSPNAVAISPSDSNTSKDTAHTIGTTQEDCGYVSQSSTASIRSLDSGNMHLPHNMYQRHGYNNYDMSRSTFHPHGPPLSKNKTSSSNKKNLDVRQFLQMWNEGDEEVSESNKEVAIQNNAKKHSQSEVINNQEQLYVLGLINVPNEELPKYDHIQKISKLPENIKGYNSIEILHQYEELVETPHISNYNKLREYHPISKTQFDKEITTKLPRSVSPLDVEAKISQSIIHKEVGCNFEIKPCSPQMLNVEIAAPMQNILGERMIEKVINPNIHNSPNLNRSSNNNKSQNIMNDTVKVTSCKMISDQYLSSSSPNRKKSNTYSVQDFESNAGLCYTSLPQLDNDIELNFPEINQQFIKANNLESNAPPGLQNVSHMDFEQTHCLPHENKNDTEQHNPSPQLPSSPVVDKELSKLSKYRKGRKNDHIRSQNIQKPDTLKSGESMATLQRIDSVIIKNPDTNKSHENDYPKINSESKHKIQKNQGQCYSSLKYENNVENYGFSTETAIDFSLNRSEDETAVSYLNEINRSINHNLPSLEEFNEEELNGGEDISFTCDSIDELNVSGKPNMSSADIIQRSELSDCEISDKYENNVQIISTEMDKNQISPKESEANEEYNVLVVKKLATAEPEIPTIKNIENADGSKSIESLVLDIKAIKNTCAASNEEPLFAKSEDTLESQKMDVEIGTKPINKSNQIDLSSSLQYDKDNSEHCYSYECSIGMKSQKELISEELFVMKNFNLENKLNVDVNEKDNTIEEVLEDLSNHNIDNLNTKCDFSNITPKNDIIEVADNSQRLNKEVLENELNVSVVNQSYEVIPDFNMTRSQEHSIDKCLPFTSESNENGQKPIAIEHLGDFENSNNSSQVVSSSSEEISHVKNETNITEFAVQIVKFNSEIAVKSTVVLPQEDSETKIDVSLDKNVTNNCKESFSASAESFSVAKDAKNELVQNNLETKSDACNFQCLPNTDCANVCKVNNKSCLLMDNETESFTCNDELVETRQGIDKSTPRIHEAYEQEKSEEIKTTSNDERVKSKQEMEVVSERVQDSSCALNIGEAEVCLSSKADLQRESWLSNNKTSPINPVVEVLENRPENDTDIHAETIYETSVFDKSCTNAYEETCVSNKNEASSENDVETAECKHETYIDKTFLETNVYILDSDLLSPQAYKNSNKSTVDFFSSNIKKVEENLSVNCSDHEDPVQKVTEMDVVIADSECISDVQAINNDEASFVSTISENSIFDPVECEILKKDNLSVISVMKSDMNYTSKTKIDHELNVNSSSKSFNIDNKCLQSWKYSSYSKAQNKDVTVKKHNIICRKELFSPWMQYLWMFTEGTCKSIFNETKVVEDICEKTDNAPLEDQNVTEILFKNHDLELLESKNNVNCELSDLETNFLNKDNANAIIPIAAYRESRPRKKRSLSESALDSYKDNFVQPCKRKKGFQENHRFLESNVITEDICNIIQTNRRNSISTFYNEDNVYIVIDNDLILTEDNNETDDLCYSENNEDFLANITPINSGVNLNAETDSCIEEPSEICEYSDSLQHIEENFMEESWVDDVACMETVFSEDVAENIIIDIQASPKKVNSIDVESVDEESTVFYESDHMDKIKSIYGRNLCYDNTKLIETLYKTPQMNVNKTLFHNESQVPIESLDTIDESCLESKEHINFTETFKSGIPSYKVIENKENILGNQPFTSNQHNENICPNLDQGRDCKLKEVFTEEQEDKYSNHSYETSTDYLTSSAQNSNDKCSSSPEVSSTTSEEKNSTILLKITNCNGSRVSQINEVSTDSPNKLSYKLTENREFRSYTSNFSSSRTLITKAAQKYIPPIKDTIYDLKVKLPLPQHRLYTLKQLKISKLEPKVDPIVNDRVGKVLKYDVHKKQKPKFEDVLKSIDEINFKRHKDNIKKGKISIPKVIIKKNENGAHYASSKSAKRKETYNPDLTGLKWQPWVFLEKNDFIDKMALHNKTKAIFCHRKHSYVLLEKFRKYKSVYNANFVISQPKSDTKGNLKYTIKLKHS